MAEQEVESNMHHSFLLRMLLNAGRQGDWENIIKTNNNGETQASSTGMVFACVSYCPGFCAQKNIWLVMIPGYGSVCA